MNNLSESQETLPIRQSEEEPYKGLDSLNNSQQTQSIRSLTNVALGVSKSLIKGIAENSYFSHKRRRIFDKEQDLSQQIQKRSQSRSLTRRQKKSGSRPSSQSSNNSLNEDDQQIVRSSLNITRVKEVLESSDLDQKGSGLMHTVIHEQDIEDTLPNDEMIKDLQPRKQSIMRMSSQNVQSQVQQQSIPKQLQFGTLVADQKLSESWQRSVEETAHSYIAELIQRFKSELQPPPILVKNSSLQKKPSKVKVMISENTSSDDEEKGRERHMQIQNANFVAVFQKRQEEHDKAMQESWEKSNQATASSYISGLISMFQKETVQIQEITKQETLIKQRTMLAKQESIKELDSLQDDIVEQDNEEELKLEKDEMTEKQQKDFKEENVQLQLKQQVEINQTEEMNQWSRQKVRPPKFDSQADVLTQLVEPSVIKYDAISVDHLKSESQMAIVTELNMNSCHIDDYDYIRKATDDKERFLLKNLKSDDQNDFFVDEGDKTSIQYGEIELITQIEHHSTSDQQVQQIWTEAYNLMNSDQINNIRNQALQKAYSSLEQKAQDFIVLKIEQLLLQELFQRHLEITLSKEEIQEQDEEHIKENEDLGNLEEEEMYVDLIQQNLEQIQLMPSEIKNKVDNIVAEIQNTSNQIDEPINIEVLESRKEDEQLDQEPSYSDEEDDQLQVIPQQSAYQDQDENGIITREEIVHPIDNAQLEDQSQQPYTRNQSQDYIDEVRAESRSEDVFDLVFHYLFKEEFKQSVLLCEKEVVDLISIKVTEKAENFTIEEIYQDIVDGEKQEMYENFLNNVLNQAQDQIISRILHEILMIYELDLIDSTADNVSHKVSEKLLETLLTTLIDDFISGNQTSTLKPQSSNLPPVLGSKQSMLKSKRQISRQNSPSIAGTLKDSKNQIISNPITKVQVIKKKDIKKVQEILDAQQTSETQKPQKMKLKKKVKHQQVSPERQAQSVLKDMKVEDLLDLEFFEKCFFGRKLTIRDQLIFRIYAKELLELIKSNLNKQMKKKKNKVFVDNKKQVNEFLSEQFQSRSKSPETRSTPFGYDLNTYFEIPARSSTPTPQQRQNLQLVLQQQQSFEDQTCLNINITNDEPNNQTDDNFNRNSNQIAHMNNNSIVLTQNDQKYLINISQNINNTSSRGVPHQQIPNIVIHQGNKSFTSRPNTHQQTSNHSGINMEGINNNEQPPKRPTLEISASQLADLNSPLAQNNNLINVDFSDANTSAIQNESKPLATLALEVPENNIQFSSSTLNPVENEESQNKKRSKSRKKRQPSQGKQNEPEKPSFVEVYSNATNGTGSSKKPPSPSKTIINSQLRIYQNLETQIKDILNKNNTALKSVKFKKRIFNNHSERTSPTHNPLGSFAYYELPQIFYNDQKYLKQRQLEQKSQTLQHNNHPVSNVNNQQSITPLTSQGITFTNDIRSISALRQVNKQQLYANTFAQGSNQGDSNIASLMNNSRIVTAPATNNIGGHISGSTFTHAPLAGSDFRYNGNGNSNQYSMITISPTPKPKIGQIIDDARKYLRIGNYQRRVKVAIENEKKNENYSQLAGRHNSSNLRGNHSRIRSSIGSLCQDSQNAQQQMFININQIEPFVELFINSKRGGNGRAFSTLKSQVKDYEQIVVGSNDNCVIGPGALFERRSKSKVKRRQLKAMNLTLTAQNSPNNSLLMGQYSDLRQFKGKRPIINLGSQTLQSQQIQGQIAKSQTIQ